MKLPILDISCKIILGLSFYIGLFHCCIMFSKFIHIVAWTRISFFSLWWNSILLHVYTTFFLFMYLLMDTWTFFCLLAIVPSAGRNISHMSISFHPGFHFFGGIYLAVELLGHMVIPYLTFWGATKLYRRYHLSSSLEMARSINKICYHFLCTPESVFYK